MRRSPRLFLLAIACLLPAACSPDERAAADDPSTADRSAELGPVDGRDLPAADLERVAVGDRAPDFRLESLRGGAVTLSEFRGAKDVVLVFFRGHW